MNHNSYSSADSRWQARPMTPRPHATHRKRGHPSWGGCHKLGKRGGHFGGATSAQARFKASRSLRDLRGAPSKPQWPTVAALSQLMTAPPSNHLFFKGSFILTISCNASIGWFNKIIIQRKLLKVIMFIMINHLQYIDQQSWDRINPVQILLKKFA